MNVHDFVHRVTQKKESELAAARTEYLALLHRLARGQAGPDDTDDRALALLDLLGRSPQQFSRDVDQLTALVRLADAARDLPAREAATREARTTLAETREELKRTIDEAEARLSALERAHDDAAAKLNEAHAAREQLLDLLGDRKGYYARLDDLRAAQEAGAGQEAQKLTAGIERVTAALLDLAAYDPFAPVEPSAKEAPP